MGAIAVWYSEADNDTWATAAMVSPSNGYSVKNWSVAYLPTVKLVHYNAPVYECFNDSTRDHFLTLQLDNCTGKSQMLRIAGWSWLAPPLKTQIDGMVPLIMVICYNAQKQDHSISVGMDCPEQDGYKGVEALGFVLAPQPSLYHTQRYQ